MSLSPAEIPADAGDALASASQGPRRVKILPVLFVLAISLGYPFATFLNRLYPILLRAGFSWLTIGWALNIAAEITIAATTLAVVHYWERLPMWSIGLAQPKVSDFVFGVCAFFAVLLVERFVSPLLVGLLVAGRASYGSDIAAVAPSQIALVSRFPWQFSVAMAASAGIFEELWARGYGIERLSALLHSTVAAAAIMLFLDLAAHLPFWGIRYAILIAPTEAVFLSLYLWRRRLLPCVIAHALSDASRPILLVSMWLLAMIFPMHATRGWEALWKGDYDQSITEFSGVLSRTPNDVRALEGRSNAYWYKGRYDKSIDDLTRLITLEPGNEHAYRNRANSYFAKHDYPRAMADANQAIKLAPEDPDTYSIRANIDAASGDEGGAIKDLGRAIKLSPSDYALIERRETLYDTTGNYDGAIADLGRLLALDPGDRYLLAERAVLYGTSGQFSLASLDDSAIISAHPKDPSGYTIRANLSYEQHQYGAAIVDLNRAIALAPDRPKLYKWRAMSFTQLGKLRDAIADWKRVLDKQPKTAHEYNTHAWILATCPIAEVRNGKQAVEFATETCKMTGWKNAKYLDTLAAAYAEQGEFADATLWEKQALAALAPSDKTIAAGMHERLALYEAGHPYRDSYPTLLF